MSTPSGPLRAIENVFGVATKQLVLLKDAARRPEVNQAQLAATCLELLLQALTAEATQLQNDGTLDPALRQRLAQFATDAKQHRQASVHARHHLNDLGKGWKCGACGGKVVAAAAVLGVKAPPVGVELVCGKCQQRTPATAEGMAQFQKWFGALVSPSWDPTQNGFVP